MYHRIRVAAILLPVVAFISIPVVALGQSASDQADADIEAIVVVGTPAEMESELAEIALTPGGVSMIDMDDFRGRNVSSLADVLRYVPGVWSTSDNGNDAIFISSRGSNLDATDWDMNGIKLLQDGLPVTTADGSNHNRIVDPLSARHASVARGANALKYGASTLGGAISFASPTAHTSPTAATAINAGSHGQMLGRLTLSEVFNDRLDGLLMLESKHWDGYREHNTQDRSSFYGNIGWQISDAVATRVYASLLENDQELPGSLSEAQVAADPDQANAAARDGNYQMDVDTWRLASKTIWQIDDRRRLEIGFSVEEQSLFHPIVDRVFVDFDGSGPAEPVEVFSLLIDTDQRNLAAVVRYAHRLGAHDLLAGFNYAEGVDEGGNYRNLGGKRNGLSSVVDNSASLVEAFVMDRWQISDRTTLVIGAQTVTARREVRTTDVASGFIRNPSDDYSSVNPRVGLLYDIYDDVSVYANVSRLFEPPTNYELEDNVAGGNATLDAMEGNVIEVGTRGQVDFGTGSNWAWEIGLYYASIDNEILSVQDPAAPGTSLVTNIDDTVHGGIEASMSSSLALGRNGEHFLEPRVSFTINDFHFDDDATYGSNRLPAAPQHVLRSELVYRNGNGFYMGPTLELVGERFADFANSYTVDSYTLLGLRAGISRDRWSAFAEVRNLLDEEYIANHGVRNVAAASDEILNPGAPLSVYFGVLYQIE